MLDARGVLWIARRGGRGAASAERVDGRDDPLDGRDAVERVGARQRCYGTRHERVDIAAMHDLVRAQRMLREGDW